MEKKEEERISTFGVILEVSSRTGAVFVMKSGVRGVVSCV